MSINRQMQLHAFELIGVIQSINDRAFTELAKARACEMVGLFTEDVTRLLFQAKNQLIDDFIQNAINSFQFCYIMGYSSQQNTPAELEWMNCHQAARSLLYRTLNLPVEASGMQVGYRRIGSVVYLAVQIN